MPTHTVSAWGRCYYYLKVRKDTLVMPERPVMSLQFKTLIVQLIKTLTKLLGEEGIQWTGKEICLRNPTNLLADHRTTDCVGSKSAPGSFLENLRHLLRQIELGKVRSIEESSQPPLRFSLSNCQGAQQNRREGRFQGPSLWGYREDPILSSDSPREMREVVYEGPWEPDTRG